MYLCLIQPAWQLPHARQEVRHQQQMPSEDVRQHGQCVPLAAVCSRFHADRPMHPRLSPSLHALLPRRGRNVLQREPDRRDLLVRFILLRSALARFCAHFRRLRAASPAPASLLGPACTPTASSRATTVRVRRHPVSLRSLSRSRSPIGLHTDSIYKICPGGPGVYTCDVSTGVPTRCKKDYTLGNGGCCPTGTYFDGSTCVSCPPGVTACAGPDPCDALDCGAGQDGQPLFRRECGHQKRRRSPGNRFSCETADNCYERQWADLCTFTPSCAVLALDRR